MTGTERPHKRLRAETAEESEYPEKESASGGGHQQGLIKTNVESLRSYAKQRTENASESESDEGFGPSLPSVAPKKKKRKLPHEKLYIAALPTSSRYSKSLMHKEQLRFTLFTPHTDFLVTTSIDGVVKFWKKSSDVVDFVKEFKAHHGIIQSIAVSADGRSLATVGIDKTVKLYDVITFDLLAMLTLEEVPRCACYVNKRGDSLPLLAVSNDLSGKICIFDGRGEQQEPIKILDKLHREPVTAMAFNNEHDCVISTDEGGMVEYWQPNGSYEKPSSVFGMKSSTDLFEFKKSKSVPSSISISADGGQFATMSYPDRKIRVFSFSSGKLHRTYDESIQTITDMQQTGTVIQRLDDSEFTKRLAVEEGINIRPDANVIFDETGHFIIYGSLFGIKVINTLTNRVVKIYGREEQFRALNLALYQGQPGKKGIVTVEMAASDNPLLREAEARDAMLVATGYNKIRFYMFTNDEEVSKSTRDVQNEKPRVISLREKEEARKAQMGTSATIHTTHGDIHIRLFPDAAPKAVENFVTHAKNGYYNNVIFHRVIKKFMIQTGDPLGDGTGGESIWGKEFADEFSSLKHDKPYTVSMANAGPDTNGSQFFITTEKTPWLDKKHTIFGRAIQGLDVVHRIENTKTYKERPEEDIKIIDVSVP